MRWSGCGLAVVLTLAVSHTTAGPEAAAQAGALLTDPNVVLQPDVLSPPPLHAPVIDPLFGTTIRRVTDAAAGGSFGTHIYSQLQAFSSDNAYLLLIDSDQYVVRRVSDLVTMPLDSTEWNAPRWQPAQPHTLVHYDSNADTTLRVQYTNVDTRTTTTVFTFPAAYQRIRNNQSFDELVGRRTLDGRHGDSRGWGAGHLRARSGSRVAWRGASPAGPLRHGVRARSDLGSGGSRLDRCFALGKVSGRAVAARRDEPL